MSEEVQAAPEAPAAQPAAQTQAAPQVIEVHTKAAPAPAAPAGVDPDKYAEAKALAEASAKQAEALKAQLDEHSAAAARAIELAKRNAKLAALPDLAKEQYLALAPDVEFDDAGALTVESREALTEWRKAHGELFKTSAGGNTPGFQASERGDYLSDDQKLMLAGVGVKDTDAWKRNVPAAVVARIESSRRNRKVNR